eukprot:2327737-Lingulodinium_polyedra.AAC.1
MRGRRRRRTGTGTGTCTTGGSGSGRAGAGIGRPRKTAEHLGRGHRGRLLLATRALAALAAKTLPLLP